MRAGKQLRIKYYVEPDSEALAHRAAQYFTEMAWEAVAYSGHARIAISGGSTPKAAFELLAAHAGHGLESARRLEHQRRDAAHFRSLIESAPDAMIVMSTEGIILEANNQVGRLFGYEPDELTGQSVERLTTPRVQSALRSYYEDFMRNPRNLVIGDVADVEDGFTPGQSDQIEDEGDSIAIVPTDVVPLVSM